MPGDPLFKIAYYLIIIWLICASILFVLLLRRYTFGEWTKEKPNPYEKETFGMPRGIFRGILTMSILFIVLLLEVLNLQVPFLVDGKLLVKQVADQQELFLPEERYKELLVAFQMVIAFYFGSKVIHHITKADERKSERITTSISEVEGAPNQIPKPVPFEEEGAVG